MFCTYCLCISKKLKSTNNIRSPRNIILNLSNFTHVSRIHQLCWFISDINSDLIGLPFQCLSFIFSITWLSEGDKLEKDRRSRAAISQQIFLPWLLNMRFNLHLCCINSKERRLRDKEEEGIDDGWSTIKAIKIVTNAATPIGACSLSLCFSNFLNCGKWEKLT